MPAPLSKIKVCGITSVEDALIAINEGAGMLGLNFYGPSPRCVGLDIAREIVNAVDERAELVGLFVNHQVDFVNSVTSQLNLHWIQLHGDEAPDYLSNLISAPSILRAYRTSSWDAVLDDVANCRATGRAPDAALIDANVPGTFGGTGSVADWSQIAERRRHRIELPLILAGGLTPENVAEAIRIVRPAGVDVASGVESSPGVKDPDKIRRFVEAAREALDSLG